MKRNNDNIYNKYVNRTDILYALSGQDFLDFQ